MRFFQEEDQEKNFDSQENHFSQEKSPDPLMTPLILYTKTCVKSFEMIPSQSVSILTRLLVESPFQ